MTDGRTDRQWPIESRLYNSIQKKSRTFHQSLQKKKTLVFVRIRLLNELSWKVLVAQVEI